MGRVGQGISPKSGMTGDRNQTGAKRLYCPQHDPPTEKGAGLAVNQLSPNLLGGCWPPFAQYLSQEAPMELGDWGEFRGYEA